jgi:hypothetical protein
MPCFELRRHAGNFFLPQKNIFPTVINQTFSCRAQIIKLARLHLGLSGYNSNHSQIFIGQAAVRPLYFEIFYCLIVVRRVSFVAG